MKKDWILIKLSWVHRYNMFMGEVTYNAMKYLGYTNPITKFAMNRYLNGMERFETLLGKVI